MTRMESQISRRSEQVSRLGSEVSAEISALGMQVGKVQAELLAEHLDAAEPVLHALRGRRWFGETFSEFESWWIVTSTRVLAFAIQEGGIFSRARIRAVSTLPFSDILEVHSEYTSGAGKMGGRPGHELMIRTIATSESLDVPLPQASIETVKQFVGALRSCWRLAAQPGAVSGRSFPEQLKLLSDLKRSGHLSDADIAQVIRRLMSE